MSADKIEDAIAYLRSIQQNPTLIKHDELKQFIGNLMTDFMKEVKEMHKETIARLDALEKMMKPQRPISVSTILPPVPSSMPPPPVQKVPMILRPDCPQPVPTPPFPTNQPLVPTANLPMTPPSHTSLSVLKDEMLIELNRLKKIMKGG